MPASGLGLLPSSTSRDGGSREVLRHSLSIASAPPAVRSNGTAPRASTRTTTTTPVDDGAAADCGCPLGDVARRRLRAWNLCLALFHGGLAAATLALGRLDLEVPLFYTVSNFSLRNESDPSAGWDLTPLYQPTDGGLPMTPLVAAFFVLSALAHLLNGSLLYNYYVAQLQRCYTPTRWVEYFFSAPLVQLLVAVTLGVRDRSLLLAFVFLTAITMPFGYWVEMIGRPRTPTAWRRPLSERLAPYWLGHVPQVGAWGLLIAQFYASDTLQSIPLFVHVILWGEVALFFSFGAASLLGQLRPPSRFVESEVLFQILSLVSKGLLGGLLLANVLMLSSFDDVYAD